MERRIKETLIYENLVQGQKGEGKRRKKDE
jgi:hypothetical protein